VRGISGSCGHGPIPLVIIFLNNAALSDLRPWIGTGPRRVMVKPTRVPASTGLFSFSLIFEIMRSRAVPSLCLAVFVQMSARLGPLLTAARQETILLSDDLAGSRSEESEASGGMDLPSWQKALRRALDLVRLSAPLENSDRFLFFFPARASVTPLQISGLHSLPNTTM